MEKSVVTIKIASNKALLANAPMVNDDVLQPGGALDMQLINYKTHWAKSVTGSGVACQLC